MGDESRSVGATAASLSTYRSKVRLLDNRTSSEKAIVAVCGASCALSGNFEVVPGDWSSVLQQLRCFLANERLLNPALRGTLRVQILQIERREVADGAAVDVRQGTIVLAGGRIVGRSETQVREQKMQQRSHSAGESRLYAAQELRISERAACEVGQRYCKLARRGPGAGRQI